MKTHVIDALDRLGVALAGRYSLERELGRGGMATVYLARAETDSLSLKILGATSTSSFPTNSFNSLLHDDGDHHQCRHRISPPPSKESV